MNSRKRQLDSRRRGDFQIRNRLPSPIDLASLPVSCPDKPASGSETVRQKQHKLIDIKSNLKSRDAEKTSGSKTQKHDRVPPSQLRELKPSFGNNASLRRIRELITQTRAGERPKYTPVRVLLASQYQREESKENQAEIIRIRRTTHHRDKYPLPLACFTPNAKPAFPSFISNHTQDFSSALNSEVSTSVVCGYEARSRKGTHQNKICNQDSFIVLPKFGAAKHVWYFGVFDGHGDLGHLVSKNIRKQLPTKIALGLSASSKCISHSNPEFKSARETILKQCYYEMNEEISKSSIDVTFSGSTALSVILDGKSLTCANVGDSRALLVSHRSINLLPKCLSGSSSEKTWVTRPLSRDHKPTESDEYNRIVAAQGKVEPYKNQAGVFVGPARVWHRSVSGPGLAMSRSIGDTHASLSGVICNPEILHVELKKEDKFLILGTDGLWEVLDNDAAAKLVVPYWFAHNPSGACMALLNEAVCYWKKKSSLNIDDITVIVVFLNVSDYLM